MKTLIIKLTDDEYKRLEEEARKEGYAILTSYIKFKLLSQSSFSTIETNIPNSEEILKRLERRIQDMINPFTAEVETLKRKIAELAEKVESLEEVGKQKSDKLNTISKPLRENPQQPQQKPKKSLMEILKERGVMYESELNLKNADAFFEKIEKEGGRVLYTDKERIAIDPDFYNSFIKKLTEVHTSDDLEAQKFLNKQEYKLFQKLRSLGIIYFDSNTKSWKISGI